MKTGSPEGLPAFVLDSEQCELLLLFESSPSIPKLAAAARRDASVISRQLQRIAQAAPVLEKQGGKWRLTEIGKRMNEWTRSSSETQRLILSRKTSIRIATTREFAARVLAPRLDEFLKHGPGEAELMLLAHEEGVERLLLEGEADLGFDCGRPTDPAISFRTVIEERFGLMATPAFIRKHGIRNEESLLRAPHLQYRRLAASRLMQLTRQVPNVSATFNDLASIREACCAGQGWAVLPLYCAQPELESGRLRIPFDAKIRSERFGIWWLRGSPTLDAWIASSATWLRGLKL